ncbi:hypothetical protein SAMN02745704_01894 [Paucidesulfovibrio gracilis DSM 16080]|uniref:Uncharacterized protein n=1 Tax=Paucidesulfovibrio gracilis DSM 16080 TaxID=1121449 RepID=A0A1T4X7F8_9BACT|nr:hypothetical protein [Paucidesulfovibrio gracilis]SKA85573.1 hypothetical protein SAMN02745704_01894 [Paucidesulfovibrio gracilis DSM 16080]
MFPELVYALLCRDVIVDRESGSASFIRAFEHGTVPSLPATVPSCFIVTLWETGPNSSGFTIGLSLVAPDGTETDLGSNQVQPTGATLHKVNFQLPGLNVSQEGRHTINLSVTQDGEQRLVKGLPLYVLPQEQS